MLCDVDWAEDGTYRPGYYYSPERFFNDCLTNSSQFDLQLGYFSSAAISVLAEGFATFISRGGYMRLVINHIVSEKDKDAINKGVNGGIIASFDLTDFISLRETFDEYQQQFFDCLSYLINRGRIDIRIIKPKKKDGIAHTKSGQFRDGDSTTSFTGSANFTISGFFNNLEEIKIDRSDSVDRMVQKRIENQKKEFDTIMNRERKDIEYLPANQLVAALQSTFGDKDIEELLDVENKLKQLKKEKEYESHEVEITTIGDNHSIIPKFPFSSGPRDYQKTAFENWKNNKQKGLFAMATGTGKTLTALNCLLEIYNRNHYYKAIILVPTLTLVSQWKTICSQFGFVQTYEISSKNKSSREILNKIRMYDNFQPQDNNFIIISTYASFSREQNFYLLNAFDRKKVLLIADEAHNMASPTIRKRLGKIVYLRRIGLSATPKRQFEEDNNHKLFQFFGVLNNFTFEYSMEQAINNGILCKYLYYPHLVKLTDAEMEEYIKISIKISKYFNTSRASFDKKEPALTNLLLARKRIIQKAQNKLSVFTQIMKDRFKETGDLRFSLVYVPEGVTPDYFDDNSYFEFNESIPSDNIATHLIDIYTEAISQVDKSITVCKFVSSSKDREKIIDDFSKGTLQVLTSMKCLDEGIDVPRSEFAVFCSSTGNPRQFIQRRGRILRTHKDKKEAIIHDLVVIPTINDDCKSYRMEQLLMAKELERVKEFAMLSKNASYTFMELKNVMEHYGLNLTNNNHIYDTER